MALTSSDENRLGEWLAWRKRLVWRPVGFDWASLSLLYKSDVLAVNKNDCDHVVLSRKGSSSRDTGHGQLVWKHRGKRGMVSLFTISVFLCSTFSHSPPPSLSIYIVGIYFINLLRNEREGWEIIAFRRTTYNESKIELLLYTIYIYEG